MGFDILNGLQEWLLTFLPDEICGIGLMAFIGMVIGIILACWEGLHTKFVKYKIEMGRTEIRFDKRYLATGVIAIIVVFLTIFFVMDKGYLTGTESFVTATTVGFTEGAVTIKTLNRRLDLFILKSSEKAGLTEDTAKELAEKINVVDETEPTDQADKDAKFEDITLKSL